VIALTSFSSQGFEVYGKKFLESAIKYWPTEILVYTEADLPLFHEKVKERDLMNVNGIESFLHYLDLNPIFKGQTQKGYNYNYDIHKFCKKSFAQLDALQSYKGKVFWLDADIVFTRPVTKEFLENVFHGKTLTCLQREGFYTETGFVGFDTEGEKFDTFLNDYENVYRKGRIFNLKQWHDCAAFDEAVRLSQVPVHNLSSFYKPGSDLHVFPKSELGPYLTHNKGNRKFQ